LFDERLWWARAPIGALSPPYGGRALAAIAALAPPQTSLFVLLRFVHRRHAEVAKEHSEILCLGKCASAPAKTAIPDGFVRTRYPGRGKLQR
jgi:hypothetical protein